MNRKLNIAILIGLLIFCGGYVGRVVHESFVAKAPIVETFSEDQHRIYRVAEVKSLLDELDDRVITVVGAVYAAPGEQFFLIPDDELSMRPDRLPPEHTIDFQIRMPDWRLRDIKPGSIYCGISVTGRFAALSSGMNLIGPIDSLTWKQVPISKKDGEQDAPSNGG